MTTDDLPALAELAALLPQYRFERLLASGGMGAVYRAEQISLERPVAIKIMPRSLSADDNYRERFKTEAKLMGALHCPNVVGIHDFGQAGPVLYIVMELLEGTNLHERMKQGPLSNTEAVRLFTQVCDALTAAHQKGVVHRDVKPENIFIEKGQQVKLGDFGIARQHRTDQPHGPTQASISGVRLGTPEYAAPELFDFQKHITHHADIFSLGVVLYEALTGKRPAGTFMPPSIRRGGVDRRFDDIVSRAMQLDPQARYGTAEEMKRDLLRIGQANVAPAANHPSAGRTPVAPPAGNPLTATARVPVLPNRQGTGAPRDAAVRRGLSPVHWGALGGLGILGVLIAVISSTGKDGKSGVNPEKSSAPAASPLAAAPATPPTPPKSSSGNDGKNPAIPQTPAGAAKEPPPPDPPAAKFAFRGHTYQLIPSRLNWDQAKSAAENDGGHLATVTSQEEYDALRGYLLPLLKINGDRCWLGATDTATEGKWQWITGEPFDFAKWGPGEPNDGVISNPTATTPPKPQDWLAWHRQNKFGARQIEWNDVENRQNLSAASGHLVEWEPKAPPEGAGTVAEKPSTTPPVPATPSSPVTVPPTPSTPAGWRPITWTAAELAKTGGRFAENAGWYVSSSGGSLAAPASVAFSDGAFRARLRVEGGARNFHIKPRHSREESVTCSLEFPGTVRISKRDNGAQVPISSWPLATKLQSGDEVRLEIRLAGPDMTVLLNDSIVGRVPIGASSGKDLLVVESGFSFRDAEWLPLDGVADPDKVLALPSAWPGNAELAAEAADFAKRRESAYAAPLAAELTKRRKSYSDFMRTLTAQKPAEAAIYKAEADRVTAETDPPAADATGAPAALAPHRKKWHDAKSELEKPLAAAAVEIWSAHLAKLRDLENSLRQAHKLADLPAVAAACSEADAAIAHFTSLAQPATKPAAGLTPPPALGTSSFPLKRPAVAGKVITWRRSAEVTHDMGAGEVPADLGPVVAIATGPDYGLALRPDGTVVQWGTTFAKHVEPPAGLADVVAVDAGSKFAVALRSDGSVVAWGFDWREKLVPGGLPPGTAISCGETQAHLLHPDGSVSYFGFPSEANASPWKAPPAFAAIRMLDDGKEAVVGLKADGSLTFLGNNKENQITGVPAKLKKSSLIACGSSVCAALSGDMLYFWGRGTGAKTAEYGRGSAKFAAIQINAAPFSSLIAARNAEGEWRFFGSSDSTDLHDAARRARGALDVKFSRDHFLALVHDARK